MPEADGDAKNFHTDVAAANDGFFLKGSGSLDWGMSNRLARVFRPQTGRTVMLAIDHGYFQGPTTGLERVDLRLVLIDASNRVAVLRKTGPEHETDVPGSHDGDFHFSDKILTLYDLHKCAS